MVLEYFNYKNLRRSKSPAQTPVLNEDDEQFLERITSEETPPPLPQRPTVILDNGREVHGKDAQVALMDGADKIPLPQSPPAEDECGLEKGKEEDKAAEESKWRKYRSYLSNLPGRPSKQKDQGVAEGPTAAAEGVKAAGVEIKPPAPTGDAVAKEQEDLTAILDQLNLSAVNNRVFSFSKESQELLEKFKQVLKDIVNGVPTAYDDLEKLLTRSESELQHLYGSLPPFLQTLVKTLPAKMTAALGPEILAASAETPGADAQALGGEPGKSEGKKRRRRRKIPSLKRLVTQQGAVASLLRSILNFLKLRFPAVASGTSVMLSLALFLLLFVFWYCHKRGRETRLERERLGVQISESDVERSASDLEDSAVLDKDTESPSEGIVSKEEIPLKASDLPSVLDLPEPCTVPLPEHADRGLETPPTTTEK